MLINPFQFHKPENLDEALKLYSDLKGARLLAGGTFLLNQLKAFKNKRIPTPKHIISLGQIEKFSKVTHKKGILSIGSMVRLSELAESQVIKDHLPQLKSICQNIATTPLRNMATIGGNLTCKLAFAELASLMMALDARFHFLDSKKRDNIIPAEDFYANGAKTDKILSTITIPIEPKNTIIYRRYARNSPVDIPLFSFCMCAKKASGKITSARIVINTGIMYPRRDKSLEIFLVSSKISGSISQEALNHLTDEIYDTQADDFKKSIIRIHLQEALEELIQTL